MLRKLKLQLPGEPLVAQYNWCQGPVPGRGPAVEKHCSMTLLFKIHIHNQVRETRSYFRHFFPGSYWGLRQQYQWYWRFRSSAIRRCGSR